MIMNMLSLLIIYKSSNYIDFRQTHFGSEMLILTGIRSVGLALSTCNSDFTSGEMNHSSSVVNIRQMNTTQHIDITAPVVVG